MALKQKIQEYGGSLAAAKGETSDCAGTLDRVKQGFQSGLRGVKCCLWDTGKQQQKELKHSILGGKGICVSLKTGR